MEVDSDAVEIRCSMQTLSATFGIQRLQIIGKKAFVSFRQVINNCIAARYVWRVGSLQQVSPCSFAVLSLQVTTGSAGASKAGSQHQGNVHGIRMAAGGQLLGKLCCGRKAGKAVVPAQSGQCLQRAATCTSHQPPCRKRSPSRTSRTASAL